MSPPTHRHPLLAGGGVSLSSSAFATPTTTTTSITTDTDTDSPRPVEHITNEPRNVKKLVHRVETPGTGIADPAGTNVNVDESTWGGGRPTARPARSWIA